MSQNGNPGPEAGQPGGAEPNDEISSAGDMLDPPIVPAAQLPVAATPQTTQQAAPQQQPAQQQAPQQQPAQQQTQQQPPPTQTLGLSTDDENRLVDRLLSSLQDMGIVQRPPPETVPNTAAEPGQENQEDWVYWNGRWWDQNRNWNDQAAQPHAESNHSQQGEPGLESGSQQGDWNAWSNWRPTDWNRGNWGKNSWKDDHTEDRDRPYLSHLDFPTFNGNNEDYATYRYTALNLKSQCGTKDHKYLAPRLISISREQ